MEHEQQTRIERRVAQIRVLRLAQVAPAPRAIPAADRITDTVRARHDAVSNDDARGGRVERRDVLFGARRKPKARPVVRRRDHGLQLRATIREDQIQTNTRAIK